MLILAGSLREIRFTDLMQVYEESNRKDGTRWRELPPGFALQLAEQEHRQYLQEVFFRTPGAVCAIWEDAGTYVSALRLEPYRDGLLLAGLETAPDHRNKGYAAALISAVQCYLKEQGPVKLYSHTARRNIPSLKLHKKCGFCVIAEHAVFLDGSVDRQSVTLLFEA